MSDKKNTEQLLRLIDIMAALRAPSGCPWDREQTPASLKPYILEEAYEVIEAIDNANSHEICDELGDLLLQVVFLAQMFSEQGQFGFSDVAESISTKLVRRHPHVFSNADATNHAQQWENIKQQERSKRGKGNKLIDRIPRNLPALKKATKVAKKMDIQSPEALTKKLHDRTKNIVEKLVEQEQQQLEAELGEILFNVVQLTQQLNIDAEDLLRKKTMQVIAEIDSQ